MHYQSTTIALFLSSILATQVVSAPTSSKQDPAFKKILDRYTIIGDFSQKEAERSISSQIFWKYPITAPYPAILPDLSLGQNERDLPSTPGEGRAIEHMNHGRTLFFAGNFEDAKKTWLAGRAKYGVEYPFHRRNDYFIGLSFLQTANQTRLKTKQWQNPDARRQFANAATFLSWALIKKKDIKDPQLDVVTPKAFYTLAAIYYTYQRFSGAVGVAEEGLKYLVETDRKDYRFEFHRIIAEAMIRNRSYLQAIQELDTAIRQDPTPQEVAEAFGRIGDVFFDLNNYELAEDMYGLNKEVNAITAKLDPVRTFLRGEALFWMGHFSEAQKVLWFAQEQLTSIPNSSELFDIYAPWASLRIADAYLARMQEAQDKNQKELAKQLTNEAKVAYDRVTHQYRKSEARKIAQLRLACLQLPNFIGKNIDHAREDLAESKTGILSGPTKEMAWACEVNSYTQREKNAAMVERVRDFAKNFPESTYSQKFVEPVRSMQATYLDDYLKEKNPHRAIAFFETNRKLLFARISPNSADGLFRAYVDTLQSNKAQEFYSHYQAKDMTDELRRLAFLGEILNGKAKPTWKKLALKHSSDLQKKAKKIARSADNIAYIYRILRSPLVTQNLGWIYENAKEWALQDPNINCELLYLTLSKRVDIGPHSINLFKEIQGFVDKQVPELLKSNSSCGLNYLALERKAGQDYTKDYAQKWLERTPWGINKPLPEMFWQASETLEKLNDTESATKLWKFLKDKLPSDAPEAKLSALRLNPTVPETQKFWSQ